MIDLQGHLWSMEKSKACNEDAKGTLLKCEDDHNLLRATCNTGATNSNHYEIITYKQNHHVCRTQKKSQGLY